MAITIKVTYRADTRRVTLQRRPSFEELHDLIKRMYKFTEEEVAIRYVDEDEELVRITCDVELHEAFQTLRKIRNAPDRQLLRLYVANTGDEDPSASQLAQLLSSISGPGLSQSVAQLSMLTSLLQNPQLSQILPALGKAQSSPFSSPQASPVPGSFEIPDWSRPLVASPLSAAQAASSQQESRAPRASAEAELRQIDADLGRLSLQSSRSSEPYTVPGKQYQFKPDPRVVAEPSDKPGPVEPLPRQLRSDPARPAAFDSFDFASSESDKPVDVQVPPMQPIEPTIISPFPALAFAGNTADQPAPVQPEPIEEVVAVEAEEASSVSTIASAEDSTVAEAVNQNSHEQSESSASSCSLPEVVGQTSSEKSVEEPQKPQQLSPDEAASHSSQKVKYQARFVRDLYVVDQQEMKPFQQFVRGWVMCNDGYAEWPVGTQMTWVAGDKLSPSLQQNVPVVKPGETVEISMEMCAPGKPGRYVGYYRLSLPNGSRFGHRVWVDIMVKEPAQQFSMPSSSHFVAGTGSSPKQEEVPAHYAKVFDTLRNMGFSNKEQVLSALKKHDGNIERAIEDLLKTMVA